MADVGFEPAAKLLGNLRDKVRGRGTTDPAVFKDILREELAEIFQAKKTIRAVNPPEVVMTGNPLSLAAVRLGGLMSSPKRA